MAKKPETLFKERVQKRLDAIPRLYYVKIQQVARRGTLDMFICYRGIWFVWELKVGKNKMDALQEYEAAWIREAGGIVREVTPENFEDCLKELLCLNG